jgi:two-component system sensor histidine kinase UhpB
MKNQSISDQPGISGILDTSFRTLADISPTGIYMTDSSGKFIYVNPAWCRMAGLSAEEASCDGWVKAIHHDDRNQVNSEWESFIKGEIPWVSEYRFTDKKGEVKWVYCIATLFKDTNGRALGIIGINLDITERKLTEELLSKNEELLRAIIENSRDGINMLDLKTGKYFLMSPSQVALTGFTADEILNITKEEAFDRSHPDDRHISVKQQEEIANGNNSLGVVEYRWKVKSGEYRWFSDSANVIRNKNGEALALVGNTRDITEHRTTVEKLKASEAEFRSLFENSLLGISQTLPDGTLLRANQAYARMYGYENPAMMLAEVTNVGMVYANMEDRKEILQILHTNRFIESKEVEVVRRDGSKLFVLVSAFEVRDVEGKVQYYQATHIDLTSQKKADKKLRMSQKKLQKLAQHLEDVREKERSQIALNLHDDFGQKLTALNLDIAWLKSRIGVQSVPVRKKLKEMSQLIFESIESIRELSSILRPAILYDLGLIPAFEWQLKKFEKQSGIRSHFSYHPENIEIDNNISLILYRILQEALTNIIRHSEASEVIVYLQLIKNKITVLIKDNGKGIDKDMISSMSSMGIAGVKERVKSVSGSVIIKGEKGSGTIIKISIPLKNWKKND